MAVAKTYDGTYREVWTETDWLDGGGAVDVQTAIPLSADATTRTQQLLDMDVRVHIDDVIGIPAPGAITVTAVQTKATEPQQYVARVQWSNTAAAGNRMKYTMEIEMIHSSVK